MLANRLTPTIRPSEYSSPLCVTNVHLARLRTYNLLRQNVRAQVTPSFTSITIALPKLVLPWCRPHPCISAGSKLFLQTSFSLPFPSFSLEQLELGRLFYLLLEQGTAYECHQRAKALFTDTMAPLLTAATGRFSFERIAHLQAFNTLWLLFPAQRPFLENAWMHILANDILKIAKANGVRIVVTQKFSHQLHHTLYQILSDQIEYTLKEENDPTGFRALKARFQEDEKQVQIRDPGIPRASFLEKPSSRKRQTHDTTPASSDPCKEDGAHQPQPCKSQRLA